jgi:LmbE family N-acetylglucosaminyl deacetylase
MNSHFIKDLSSGEAPRSLRLISMPSDLRVLVVGPHPDDFDAIALTMSLLRANGNRIDVGVVQGGSGAEDSYVPGATQADKAQVREREQRASARFFGLPDECLAFLDLVNDETDQPEDLPANTERLRQFVLAKRPDLVFLPHGNDTNSGHRAVYSMFTQVATQADTPLVAVLNKDAKTVGMRTDVYTPFGPTEAEWKAELLRFHDSQHQRNINTRGHGFDDRILNLNRQIAQELGLDEGFAEAFELEFHNTTPS